MGETFHLCSKPNSHFLYLLVKKELFIFATDFLSLLLTKRLFALARLLTSQPLLIFFKIYTQKVKILAKESCGVVKNEI
jgi:hypothetical protein